MSYESADELMSDVRRWDTNAWTLRDVTAHKYWTHRGRPDAVLERTVTSIREAEARGDERGRRAQQLIDRIERDVYAAARRALERANGGEAVDDDYAKDWITHAKTAIEYAVVGEVAEPWTARTDRESLTAGYRAADEELQFHFSITTLTEQQGAASERFIDEVRQKYPGSDITFDPPGREVRRFDFGGIDYLPGDPDAADRRLKSDLEGLLRQHDPDGSIQWPPRHFHSRRPSRF
jgi:hypothetical protein